MRFALHPHTLGALFLGLALSALAQDAEVPTPPARKGTVRITFVPPPMEGTLSLGVYDKAGKLVRVLAREAAEKDFTIGLNGLITSWDGRDDAGRVMPAGSYEARGFSVGGIDVEGVAYHCNDWIIDDESPRIREVVSLQLKGERLTVLGKIADDSLKSVEIDGAGKFRGDTSADPRLPATAEPTAEAERWVEVKDGRVVLRQGAEARPLDLPEVTKPLDASMGREGVWLIDQVGEQVEVKEFSVDGDFRRRLAIDPAEPAPRRIFASRSSDLIFLIEEKPGLQRVRGLALEAAHAETGKDGEPATSTWKTVLSRSITASDTFQSVSGRLGRILPFIPRDKFTANLLPNQLLQDALTSVNVTIGIDAKGSFLKTVDGLPLRRITAAPRVKWAVIGQEGSGKQLTIFQGDGVVVEEFKARKLANMMAFDAGDFEWAGK